MSRIEAQSRSGESQPLTAVATALPADPSRADPMVRIHHHGSEASTVVTVAITLRSSCFMVLLVSGRARHRASDPCLCSTPPPAPSPPRRGGEEESLVSLPLSARRGPEEGLSADPQTVGN